MTKRIYYNDPTILEFEANIIESGKRDNHFFTLLDRTAFYPTSGGQLYDTGRINDIAVFDVIEENNNILHFTDQNVGEAGNKVTGIVDQKRRQINRQNHSAQHILSQSFIKLYDFETVSVHLGEEYGAIELNTDTINPAQLKEAEAMANEILTSNLPIEILFVDSEDLKNYPLRKIPDRTGSIRIIKTGDFDISACGGTHCNSTSEVGLIKITEPEKMRNHVLVKFLAGSLAVEDYYLRYDITCRLSTDMTCHVNDLVGKFEKLSEESREQRKKIAQLNKELLPSIIDGIAAKAEKINKFSFVFESLNDFDKKLLNNMASQIAQKINGIAIISAESKIVIAIDKTTKLSAGELTKKITSFFGLKGGGNSAIAQIGGVDSEQSEKIREYVIKILSDEQ